jgi:hypothetical protein
MALDKVSDYINEARSILQDKGPVQRYPDEDLVSALGMALLEFRRVRPDLFIGTKGVPQDIGRTTSGTTAVVMEPMYRPTLLNLVIGHVLSRESEEQTQQSGQQMVNRAAQKLLTPVV